MINEDEFYKIRDYDRSIYERFYQNRAYLKLRDEVKSVIVYSAFPGLGDLIISAPFFTEGDGEVTRMKEKAPCKVVILKII